MARKFSKRAIKGINRGVSLGYEDVPQETATVGAKKIERPTGGVLAESDFGWTICKKLVAQGKTEEEAKDKAREVVNGDFKPETSLPAFIAYVGVDKTTFIEELGDKYPTLQDIYTVKEQEEIKQMAIAEMEMEVTAQAKKTAKKMAIETEWQKKQAEKTALYERDAEAMVNKTIRRMRAKQNKKNKKAQREQMKHYGVKTMEELQERKEEFLLNDFEKAGFKVKRTA